MLVVKTLILTDETLEFERVHKNFTQELLELPYGCSLNGIRYDNVQNNVEDSARNEEYDEYVRMFQARAGFYEAMKAIDERNVSLGDSPKLTKTIEEVREIAREVSNDEQQT